MYTVFPPQEQHLTYIETFLSSCAESSMFIRSNLRRAGLQFEGGEYQGEYLLALSDQQEPKGVLSHYWNGMVLMQAPEEAALISLVGRFKELVNRPILGVIGPTSQVARTIELLSLSERVYAHREIEDLYALDLALVDGRLNGEFEQIVPARCAGRDCLLGWIKAYEIEALGRLDSSTLDAIVEERVCQILAGDDAWVLIASGVPVSFSGFNARLPDMVQVGPVWTPPGMRNLGYARRLLAETLRIARDEGVKKAILFTANPAAAKAYESVGFTRIGSYQIAILQS